MTAEDFITLTEKIPTSLDYISTTLDPSQGVFNDYITPLYNQLVSFGELGLVMEQLRMGVDTSLPEFKALVDGVQPGLYNQIMSLDFRAFSGHVAKFLNAYEDILQYMTGVNTGINVTLDKFNTALTNNSNLLYAGQPFPLELRPIVLELRNELYELQSNFIDIKDSVLPLSDMGNPSSYKA
jgi:hypothetical protein